MVQYSKLLIALSFLLTSFSLQAQETEKEKNCNKLEWLRPDHFTLNYAGSIGLIALGPGYQVFKNKANLDLLYGYVPENLGGNEIHSITSKFSYYPWNLSISENIKSKPVYFGTYLNYSLGDDYFFSSTSSDKYVDAYYTWSSALRVGFNIGTQIDLSFKKGKKKSHYSFYFEVGSYDLALSSYLNNLEHLNLGDALKFGVGLKAHF